MLWNRAIRMGSHRTPMDYNQFNDVLYYRIFQDEVTMWFIDIDNDSKEDDLDKHYNTNIMRHRSEKICVTQEDMQA